MDVVILLKVIVQPTHHQALVGLTGIIHHHYLVLMHVEHVLELTHVPLGFSIYKNVDVVVQQDNIQFNLVVKMDLTQIF